MFLYNIYLYLFIYLSIIIFVVIFFSNYIRLFSYYFFSLIFIITWFLILVFNKSILWFQLIIKFYTINYLQISYIIGIDMFQYFLW